MIALGSRFFLRNTYLHLAEHQCSVEHSLANAGLNKYNGDELVSYSN
jgi:aminoglycoside N3'-acetyltransferase